MQNKQKKLFEKMGEDTLYVVPPESFLIEDKDEVESEQVLNRALFVQETLQKLGIDATVTAVVSGCAATRYELSIGVNTKVRTLLEKIDEIERELSLEKKLRVQAPIVGKRAVGLELPNKVRQPVLLQEVIQADTLGENSGKIGFTLGKDIDSKPVFVDMDKCPSILIAGGTGSERRNVLDTIVLSQIYRFSPSNVRFVFLGEELKHFLSLPHSEGEVYTTKESILWALEQVLIEAQSRKAMFSEQNIKDINEYNNIKENPMPYIIVMLSEVAHVGTQESKKFDSLVEEIVKLARQTGIRLVFATEKATSESGVTSTIRAVFGSRIAFAVESPMLSRAILDVGGAEKLLGEGDMLLMKPFYEGFIRVQGVSVIDEQRIKKIVECTRVCTK